MPVVVAGAPVPGPPIAGIVPVPPNGGTNPEISVILVGAPVPGPPVTGEVPVPPGGGGRGPVVASGPRAGCPTYTPVFIKSG